MADKKSKAESKRLPRGHRKHIRRLKQAARQAGIPFRRPSTAPRPPELTKKEEQA